jgi:glutamate/tyrosine decarboxylase-like PLP-dependent enzyme
VAKPERARYAFSSEAFYTKQDLTVQIRLPLNYAAQAQPETSVRLLPEVEFESVLELPLNPIKESSLDPDNWEEFRLLAHRMLDEAIDFTADVRDRPVWKPVPQEVRTALREPVPVEGLPLETVCAEFQESILPYATGNIHPRFLGWVHGSGQAGNIVAEMLAAAMNCNCGGRDHGAIYVERAIIEWCRQIFGFPAEASGLLLSGSSMANLDAIGVARHAADPSVRTRGFTEKPAKFVAYSSAEAHESVAKALEMLGLGSASLRRIPVHSDFTMRIDALKSTIAADRAAGLRPFCVVGSAGTVNTGAIDDLDQLASLCASENIWFHVDGAFGALCILSDALRLRLKGIERADSIAFDFHKWMHVQYDAGCVLVRNGALHRAAYATRPAYLDRLPRGLAGGENWPCDFGPELSRSFRALKVWFAMKQHGIRRFGELIEQNCAQARYLAARIVKESELEILAPASLNIVCFRCRNSVMTESELDLLNEDIVADLQTNGIAAPSTSRIAGRLAIRVNITNHRTRTADLDLLVDSVLQAARLRTVRTPTLPGV